jgi:hypothetical protein
MEINKHIVKVKELIGDEVCMGTFGLVELELKEWQKEIEGQGWISVKDRLPEIQEDVLLYQKETNCIYSGYYEDESITDDDPPRFVHCCENCDLEIAEKTKDGFIFNVITHWMPLHKPPTQ